MRHAGFKKEDVEAISDMIEAIEAYCLDLRLFALPDRSMSWVPASAEVGDFIVIFLG